MGIAASTQAMLDWLSWRELSEINGRDSNCISVAKSQPYGLSLSRFCFQSAVSICGAHQLFLWRRFGTAYWLLIGQFEHDVGVT